VTALDRRRIDLFTVTLNPISLGARENSSVPIRSDRSTSPCLTRRRLALALTSIILASPLIRMAHLATGKPGFAKSSFTIFRSTESAKTRANTGSDGRCRTAYYWLSFIYRIRDSFNGILTHRWISTSFNEIFLYQIDISLYFGDYIGQSRTSILSQLKMPVFVSRPKRFAKRSSSRQFIRRPTRARHGVTSVRNHADAPWLADRFDF